MSDLVRPHAPNASAIVGTSISTPLVVASSRTPTGDWANPTTATSLT